MPIKVLQNLFDLIKPIFFFRKQGIFHIQFVSDLNSFFNAHASSERTVLLNPDKIGFSNYLYIERSHILPVHIVVELETMLVRNCFVDWRHQPGRIVRFPWIWRLDIHIMAWKKRGRESHCISWELNYFIDKNPIWNVDSLCKRAFKEIIWIRKVRHFQILYLWVRYIKVSLLVNYEKFTWLRNWFW